MITPTPRRLIPNKHTSNKLTPTRLPIVNHDACNVFAPFVVLVHAPYARQHGFKVVAPVVVPGVGVTGVCGDGVAAAVDFEFVLGV